MANDETTKVNADGLRYSSKKGGSPFGSNGYSQATMSCFQCGTHKPRSQGGFERRVGTNMFFCFDCKPAKPKG